MLCSAATLTARRLQASLQRLLPTEEAVNPIHAGLCTAFERLLSADATVTSAAHYRFFSSLAEPLEAAAPPAVPQLLASSDDWSSDPGASSLTGDKSASHGDWPGQARVPDQEGPSRSHGNGTRPLTRAPRGPPQGRGPPRQGSLRGRRWPPTESEGDRQQPRPWQQRRPDQDEDMWQRHSAAGASQSEGAPRPRGPQRSDDSHRRMARSTDGQNPSRRRRTRAGDEGRQGKGWLLGEAALPLEDETGVRGDGEDAFGNGEGGGGHREVRTRWAAKQRARAEASKRADGELQLQPSARRPPPASPHGGAVGPLVPQQSPAEEVAGIHGNLQTFILQRAEWAVKEATPAALRAYVADLTELLKLRRSSLHMVQISSCIHRLGRVVSVVSMRRNPLDHTDSYVEETPGFKELLSELSALAVEMASEMDGRAVPNVLWAMGQMRQNPCEGKLLEALCTRILGMCRNNNEHTLNAMGCAHIFWSFASLRTNPLDGEVLDAVGEHLMKLEVAEGFTGIDLSNIFWACGILGINPCGGRLLLSLAGHVTAKAHTMNQQGCSNTLWGIAKQDIKPQELHKESGQPYIAMIEALVARSTEVMSQDAAPVNFSMIIWALGSMNYHPGQAYMRDVIAHLQASRLIQRFDAQNLCNMIWGMARLAEHPGETLMAFYRQCQDRMLHDRLRSKADTEQALTNTLWAMAVLDELEPNVAAEVYKLIEPQSCNIVAHAQLFQAHLYLFSALPKGAAPPMPLVLFKACKDSWNTIKHQVRVSSLQWSILNAVRHAGFKVHPEYNDGLFSIDVAVFLESSNGEPIKVAIEADGVEHYTVNKPLVNGVQQHRPTGRTILRNKLLRARGWLVVDVPYFEWNALRTSAARTDYLKAAIALEVQTKYKFMRQREISRSRGLSRPAAAAASA